MVKAVKIKLNSSGSFYNESLGTTSVMVIIITSDTFELNTGTLEEKLEVFPNPSVGAISVVSNSVIERITLTDIMGREVLKLLPNDKKVNLNLDHFKRGLYIALIQCENGVIRTRKIVLK